MKKRISLLTLCCALLPIVGFSIDCFGQFSVEWHTVHENFEEQIDSEWCQNVAGCIHDTIINFEASKLMVLRNFDECIAGN